MDNQITRKQLEIAVERAGAAMANALFYSEVCSAIPAETARLLRSEWDFAIGQLHQAAHLGAPPAPALPSTPEQVEEFIGKNYRDRYERGFFGVPLEPNEIFYDLSVSDLQTAFREWQQPAKTNEKQEG